MVNEQSKNETKNTIHNSIKKYERGMNLKKYMWKICTMKTNKTTAYGHF